MAKSQNHPRPPPRHHPPPPRHHSGGHPPPSRHHSGGQPPRHQPPHIYHQQRPSPQQQQPQQQQRQQILPVWDHYNQQLRPHQQLPVWNQQQQHAQQVLQQQQQFQQLQQQRQQHQQQQPLQQQQVPGWDPHSPAEIPRRKPPKPPKSKRRPTLASCIVATVFLLFLLIVLSIVYFSVFKPKPPSITITSITLPTFSLSTPRTTPTSAAVSFTFSLYAAVHNPNHATFSHYDSSLQLLYAGNQVGFMFIPAGDIAASRTKYMSATFSVQSFPVLSPAGNVVGPPVFVGVNRVSPTMEIEMRMDLEGRVRVFWFFNHHVKNVAQCRVAVAINDGSVLGFHC